MATSKKILVFLLIGVVLNLTILQSVSNATTIEEKESKFAEKVKVSVKKLGIGKDSQIEVKLKDGTKLKGYISEIKDDSFAVTNDKTGESTSIPYPEAKQVKGNNLSTGAKIAIGLGIFFGAIFVYALFATRS